MSTEVEKMEDVEISQPEVVQFFEVGEEERPQKPKPKPKQAVEKPRPAVEKQKQAVEKPKHIVEKPKSTGTVWNGAPHKPKPATGQVTPGTHDQNKRMTKRPRSEESSKPPPPNTFQHPWNAFLNNGAPPPVIMQRPRIVPDDVYPQMKKDFMRRASKTQPMKRFFVDVMGVTRGFNHPYAKSCIGKRVNLLVYLFPQDPLNRYSMREADMIGTNMEPVPIREIDLRFLDEQPSGMTFVIGGIIFKLNDALDHLKYVVQHMIEYDKQCGNGRYWFEL